MDESKLSVIDDIDVLKVVAFFNKKYSP